MQALIKALVKAQQSFTPIEKDKVNPHYKNRYASLDSVLSAVNPALHANGLAVVQTTSVEGDRFVLITRLLHESGDELASTYILPDIQDPQKLGSAITYARRYAICALLNVTADEDDDGEAAKPSGNKPTAVPVKGNAGVVSEAQRKRLFAIAKQKGIGTDQLKGIVATFGFESGKDITTAKYDQIVKAVEAATPEANENEDVPVAG